MILCERIMISGKEQSYRILQFCEQQIQKYSIMKSRKTRRTQTSIKRHGDKEHGDHLRQRKLADHTASGVPGPCHLDMPTVIDLADALHIQRLQLASRLSKEGTGWVGGSEFSGTTEEEELYRPVQMSGSRREQMEIEGHT